MNFQTRSISDRESSRGCRTEGPAGTLPRTAPANRVRCGFLSLRRRELAGGILPRVSCRAACPACRPRHHHARCAGRVRDGGHAGRGARECSPGRERPQDDAPRGAQGRVDQGGGRDRHAPGRPVWPNPVSTRGGPARCDESRHPPRARRHPPDGAAAEARASSACACAHTRESERVRARAWVRECSVAGDAAGEESLRAAEGGAGQGVRAAADLDALSVRVRDRRWAAIASNLPGRNGKQCRERWHNQLDPSIKRDSWTEEEDRILMEVCHAVLRALSCSPCNPPARTHTRPPHARHCNAQSCAQSHRELGSAWVEISKRLPGRTDNAIKNRWNSSMRKRYAASPRMCVCVCVCVCVIHVRVHVHKHIYAYL